MYSRELRTTLVRIRRIIRSVSRTYAATFGLQRTDEWFMLKLQEEVGELTQALST